MSIPLVGSGGIFTICGKIGFLINSTNLFRGNGNLSASSACSVGSGIDAIAGQFTSSANRPLVDSLFALRDRFRATPASFISSLQQLAQNTLIQLADNDVRLSALTVEKAMALLISQMKDSSDTVNACGGGASGTSYGGANVGDAVLVATNVGPVGVLQEYAIPETIRATCTTDSQRGATAGSELWAITSPVPQPDALSWDWPKGSGINTSLQAADASLDGLLVNGLLVNGDFEGFVSDEPDYWTIETGTAGTTIFAGSGGEIFTGEACLKITGDGAELTEITQEVVLTYSTVYAINCWLKVSAVPSGGALAIELIDGSGNVVDDDAGTANAITKDLTTATTSYVSLHGTFRTPAILPSTLAIRVRLTTALESGKDLLLDRLALVKAANLYAGGPYVAIFSGATSSMFGDEATFNVSNNLAGKFQILFEKLFGMRALGMQLPSDDAGTETIDDALIG